MAGIAGLIAKGVLGSIGGALSGAALPYNGGVKPAELEKTDEDKVLLIDKLLAKRKAEEKTEEKAEEGTTTPTETK